MTTPQDRHESLDTRLRDRLLAAEATRDTITVRWNQIANLRLILAALTVGFGFWWLRTGDAARRDEEGYVWIVDRVADHFLLAGRPVYPGDVERVLTGHPSLADAGVVKVLDQTGGEAMAAVVVLSAGSRASEPELLAYGRRHLPAHQAPTSVRFVDRLPRNSVGKLLRAELRALASPPESPTQRSRR